MTKAMVLAAGVGSRLEPISRHLPKPLVPVLNIPVISHILACLKHHGINEVIANTHYMAESINAYFQCRPVSGIDIRFLHEPELTGDAGGVRACRDFLKDDTFVVIMGDLLTNADIGALLKAHREKSAIATIGLKKVEDVRRFGVMLRDENGFIRAFQEKPQAHEAISNEISTGIYILEPAIFDHIPENGVYGFGRQLFPSLVKAGMKVLGEEINGYWSDIGTLQDLFRANMEALSGKISLPFAGECISKSSNNCVSGSPVLLGRDTVIGEGTKLGDCSIIGARCRIGENCQFEHCLIFPDSNVISGAVLKNCIYAFEELIPMPAVSSMFHS